MRKGVKGGRGLVGRVERARVRARQRERRARSGPRRRRAFPPRLTRDDDKVRARLERVEHLDDVLVPQVPQDLDLLPQVAQVALALASLGDELERDDAPCRAAAALVHLSSLFLVCSQGRVGGDMRRRGERFDVG